MMARFFKLVSLLYMYLFVLATPIPVLDVASLSSTVPISASTVPVFASTVPNSTSTVHSSLSMVHSSAVGTTKSKYYP